jgi:SagB-type dehydrogenase family enzyme
MKRRELLQLALLVPLIELVGCSNEPTPAPPVQNDRSLVPLPSPALSGSVSLEEALSQRRSVREYGEELLTSEELGQLLWAAQGITHERGLRTAPSAGALYPLEVYVATPDGAFHYQPDGHRLELHKPADVRRELFEVALRQEPVRQAPAVFVIAAVYERTAAKYGQARSPRYVHLEAGHAAQNLLLESVALGLGAVPIGAFDDGGLQRVLGLPSDHEPLYLIAVGHPLDRRG